MVDAIEEHKYEIVIKNGAVVSENLCGIIWIDSGSTAVYKFTSVGAC